MTDRLTLDNISKYFDNGYCAANEISLNVKEGEFVTLLGPSGCGKTTLLKIIAGFHNQDSGDVLINGQVVNDMPPERRNTAMCFQSYALFPHMNVSHNICFGLVQQKMPLDQQISKLNETLKQVGLVEHKLKMPAQLSGGQQQRVALARAVITLPDVILFDEPLSNLDAKLRDSVRMELKELQRKYKLTSIYVTHDQAEALSLSDKIVVLNKGNVEQMGTPKEIYNNPANSFVADFIGSANILEGTMQSIDGQSGSITSDVGEFIYSSDYPNNCEVEELRYFCFRPEDIKLNTNNATVNTFDVSITKISFIGNLVEAYGTTIGFDKELRLQLSKNLDVQEGQTYSFFVRPEHIKPLELI
ncbi:ABC transporter ATP-binding protein [Vibrio sp. M260112]|uniref:ABC transporter ATP-binding protein n=1 Tax=Vibrio sp. M260112 TaxID=3020895 RepID=UPI002F420B20